MIQQKQFEAPKFIIDKEVKNFYDFTPDSFGFENYQFNDMKYDIEVAK